MAAQVLIEGVLLFVHRCMEPLSDELLDSLCRSLLALALGPSFHFEVALSIACAVVCEAQEAEGLWPSLPLLGGISLGKAPKLDEARLFGCQFQPKGF